MNGDLPHLPIDAEKALLALVANSPAVVYIKDLDGRILVANEALRQLVGLSFKDMLGKTDFELFDRELAQAFHDNDRKVVETKSKILVEERAAQASGDGGEGQTFRSHKFPIFNAAGEVAYTAGISLDITAQKSAEQAAKRSAEEFRSVFDLAPIGAVQADPATGQFRHVNEQFCKITGYKEAELLALTLSDLTHPEDRAADWIKFRKHALGETAFYANSKRYLRKNGEVIHVQARARVIRDAFGVPLRTIGVIEDITERLRAEQAVKLSEKRYRTLAEMLPQLVWTCLPSGHCDYLSSQWQDYTGLAETEQLGLNWLDRVIHPADRERVFNHWMGAVAGKHSYDIEYRIRRADGVYRWFKTRGTPVKNETGEIVYWFGTCTDIEDGKRVEADLATAKEFAESASRAKTQFLANMSHEIRTPMNAILGFTELLADHAATDEEKASYIDRIKGSGRHLLAIIDDILDLTKVEAGQLMTERAPFSVLDLTDEVAHSVSVLAKRKNIRLKIEADASVPETVESDPLRIKQILTNLLSNAIKFTENGQVYVRLLYRAGALSIEVEDTGIGIALNRQDSLFSPFTQADASVTRKYGGTGLGLSLSRKLAQALGGDLTLAWSLPAQGSCFSMTVPAGLVSQNRAQKFDAAAVEDSVAPERRFSGLHVLLVDDSADNEALMKIYLKKEGMSVTVARNGEEAIAKASLIACDLVLMDIQMPVMDGLEATRILRERGFRAPIIALTAHALREERERSLAAGCDVHLTKPVDKNELLATISTVLRRTAGTSLTPGLSL